MTERVKPTMWTAEIVKQRFCDAADCLRRIKVSGVWPAGYTSGWPDIVRDAAELFALQVEAIASGGKYEQPEPTLARPSSLEISQMDETFGWVEMIGDEREIDRLMGSFHSRQTAERTVLTWRRLILARAFGMSWRKLEDRDGRSRETLRKLHNEALAAVARRLGEKTVWHPWPKSDSLGAR